ncbi:MAG TPA: DUF3182 family protein [Burkholderiales bacterium]|nr:DUF3182 family protein [Burkholderiales bacterium]
MPPISRPDVRGTVVRYAGQAAAGERRHERASRTWVAQRLAALKRYEYGGEYDPGARYDGPLYFVPNDTVVGVESARRLGIENEADLFGGVVPYPFIATKTITHPLVSPEACAPEGWSDTFAARVRDAVFPGYSAFTSEDARLAAQRVLKKGSARVKLGRGIGGMGQEVIASLTELDALLERVGSEALRRDGIVIEWNLEYVITYSVGQVRVAGLTAGYCGTQRTTPNAAGMDVYGGSDLLVVRGGFEALQDVELTPQARLAVEQACKYDAAAFGEFPGFIASRRNYDVAQGMNTEGRPCSGVLEQSWRIGGASAAEVAALEAFRADPATRAVRASTVEVYGEAQVPPHAMVQYSGDDEHTGPITKYTVVTPYADTH